MLFLVCTVLLAASALAAPGYPSIFDDYHAPDLFSAPTIIKTALPAPVLASAPIIAHEPLAPTIIKAAAPVYAAPVIKTVAPATSYASVTQVHVTHPQAIVKVAQPVYKTVVAPPPIIAHPVLKSYSLPAPWAGLDYH